MRKAELRVLSFARPFVHRKLALGSVIFQGDMENGEKVCRFSPASERASTMWKWLG